MAISWTAQPLKEILTLSYGKALPARIRVPGKIPVYGSGGISGYHNKAIVTAPTIIVGRKGSIGTVYLEKSSCYPIDTVFYVEIDTKKHSLLYIYYLLQTMGLSELNSDAAVPGLNRDIAYSQIVRLPNAKNTQDKIAGVLSAYDDLIENNSRRIQILEEMAQKLYKEWFVDFRFPDYKKVKFIESESGRIPDGWTVEFVEDILDRKKAGSKYTQDNVLASGKIPVIDQSTSSVLGYHNNQADHIATPKNPVIIFGDHTCKMQLMIRPFSVGANVIPFIAKRGMPSAFIYYLVNSLVNTKEYKRHWTELVSNKVVLPPDSLQRDYAKRISPLIQQIDALQNVNLNLATTRDFLLPRLISGELSVEDLEVQI